MKVDKLEIAVKFFLVAMPTTALLSLWLDSGVWHKVFITSVIGFIATIVLFVVIDSEEEEE